MTNREKWAAGALWCAILAVGCGGAKTGTGPGDVDLTDHFREPIDAAVEVVAPDYGPRQDDGADPLGTDLGDDVPTVDGDIGTDAGDCTAGGLKGVTCAPNQLNIVAYADVTLDVTGPCTKGKTIHMTTKADEKGQYQFDYVPPGDAVLSFEKGSYSGSVPLGINPGQVTDLTGMAKRCFPPKGSAKIAVIQGNADNIEALLDELKLENDKFSDGTDTTPPASESSAAQALLADPATLNTYDILFIDCSSSTQWIIESSPDIIANLKAFVESGKSLYASDWAWNYIEKAWPDAINFYGSDAAWTKGDGSKPATNVGPRQGPGPTLSEKEKGAKPYSTTGTIIDTDLEKAIGKNAITLYYDLGTWVIVDKPGTIATTAIEATVTGDSGTWGKRPQLITFQPTETSGRVLFTSFHNIAQQDAQGNVDDIKAILSYVVFSL